MVYYKSNYTPNTGTGNPSQLLILKIYWREIIYQYKNKLITKKTIYQRHNYLLDTVQLHPDGNVNLLIQFNIKTLISSNGMRSQTLKNKQF